jgi:hypothetical protein
VGLADFSRIPANPHNELQSKPSSSTSWLILANEHPEFFRVRDDTKKVSLLARFVRPKIEGTDNRLQLDTNETNKLMEIAIEIHDRQVRHRDSSIGQIRIN